MLLPVIKCCCHSYLFSISKFLLEKTDSLNQIFQYRKRLKLLFCCCSAYLRMHLYCPSTSAWNGKSTAKVPWVIQYMMDIMLVCFTSLMLYLHGKKLHSELVCPPYWKFQPDTDIVWTIVFSSPINQKEPAEAITSGKVRLISLSFFFSWKPSR